MPIVFYLIIIINLILAEIGIAGGMFGYSKKQVVIGFIIFIIGLSLVIVCGYCAYQDINLETVKYYKCVLVDFGNDGKKIICVTPYKIMSVDNTELIYTNNIIVKEYQYISKKGLVDWMNGEQRHYKYIMPNDEEYEIAKNNISNVKIKIY